MLQKYAQENVFRMFLILVQLTIPITYFFRFELSFHPIETDFFYLSFYIAVLFFMGLYNLFNLVDENKNKISYQPFFLLIGSILFVDYAGPKLLAILFLALRIWVEDDLESKKIDKRFIFLLLVSALYHSPSIPFAIELSYFLLFMIIYFQALSNHRLSEIFIWLLLMSMKKSDDDYVLVECLLLFISSVLALKFILEEKHKKILENTLSRFGPTKRLITYFKIKDSSIYKIDFTPSKVYIKDKKTARVSYLAYKSDSLSGIIFLLFTFILGMVTACIQ